MSRPVWMSHREEGRGEERGRKWREIEGDIRRNGSQRESFKKVDDKNRGGC